MKAYKVVSVNNVTENRESAIGYDRDPRTTLLYKKGHTTKPVIPNSKLFVFDTLKNAENYRHPGMDEIWECEVDCMEKCTVELLPDYFNGVLLFWEGNYPNNWSIDVTPPIGTHFANKVTLTKLVRGRE